MGRWGDGEMGSTGEHRGADEAKKMREIKK
jgi:hypothetical protein